MTTEVQKEKLTRIHLLKQLMERDSSFLYYGNFTDSINDALIPLVENLMDKTEVSMVTRKRTFYILIECIQNVNRHHYKPDKEQNLPKEVFWVEGDEGQFNIVSGNAIESADVPSLRSKIMKLNSLSSEALNAHYKTILKETVLTTKGGAGLGLIEVVRKSSNKIRFKFKKLNEQCSFFSMETTIQKREQNPPDPGFRGIGKLEELNKFYNKLSFGLTLMGRCANNELSDIETIVHYINKLSVPEFFEKQDSAESFHGLIVHLANICFQQPKFADPHMLLQFEIENGIRNLIIGWLVPDAEASECFNRLEAHIHSQPTSVVKILNGMMNRPSPFMELNKFQVKNNNQLFTIQLQQER